MAATPPAMPPKLPDGFMPSSDDDVPSLDDVPTALTLVHGVGMLAAFALLFPLGAAMPTWKGYAPTRWFRLHLALQLGAAFITAAALAAIIYATPAGTHFDPRVSIHKLMGLLLGLAILLQIFLGFVRPHKPKEVGETPSARRRRQVWERLHRGLGALILVGALPQITTGIASPCTWQSWRGPMYVGLAAGLGLAAAVAVAGVLQSRSTAHGGRKVLSNVC